MFGSLSYTTLCLPIIFVIRVLASSNVAIKERAFGDVTSSGRTLRAAMDAKSLDRRAFKDALRPEHQFHYMDGRSFS